MLIRKKIAIVTSSPGTVMAFLQNHIKLLSSEFDVYVISNIKGEHERANLKIDIDKNVYGNIEKYASFIHIPIVRRISIFNDIKTIVSLYKISRKNQFSSIHSITSKVGILVMISAFIAGVDNRLHTYTGQVWANMNGTKRFFFKTLDKIIGLLCTNCYADSRSQMDFLVNENVVNKKKISVLGEGSISGVDLTRFYPDRRVRTEMREKFGISDDEIVFLLLCRLTIDKGVVDMAKAFSQIVNELSCTLLIVGPDEENLTNEIESIVGSEFTDKLIFEGFTDCHERFLNMADILCLPSYREGFGTVIIDAAATGIPSIGSDIYGIRDAIVDGVTGLLHKPGDIAAIKDSMLKLATDNLLRRKMGMAALQRVKNSFTMEEISQAWLTEYNDRLRNKK